MAPSPNVVTMTGSAFLPGKTAMMGAPGQQIFVYAAHAAGNHDDRARRRCAGPRRDGREDRALQSRRREEPNAAHLRRRLAAWKFATRVVGAGTMGAGIAMTFADAGIDVCPDRRLSDQALERGRATIARVYESALAEKGQASTRTSAHARDARIATGTSYGLLANADVVVEAVFEDLALKRDIFARARRGVFAADAILATNTSTLDVDVIAAAAPHAERSLGLHFFSPGARDAVARDRTRHGHVPGETIVAAVALGCAPRQGAGCRRQLRRLRRQPDVASHRREAELLLEAGATPEQVDGALRAFGFAMGPFAVADLAGVDIGWRAKQERLKKGPSPFRLSNIPDLLVAADDSGRRPARAITGMSPASGRRTPIPPSTG